MQDLFDLTGRDIWVIGGAGYLGTATVRQLVRRGARVLCADLAGRAAAMVTEQRLADSVTPVSLDAGDEVAIEEFVRQHIKSRGVPSGLVVMTFKSTAKKLDDLTADEFNEANRVGLTGTFLLARSVGQAMAAEGRGSIVLFSSMYGTVSPDPRMYPEPLSPNPIEYGVGKAGIQQMARYFAVHLAEQNVRCNSVSPGPFPFVSIQEQNPEWMKRITQRCPMGRVGRAEEIAGPVSFLVSDASTYVTGQNLAVDGGWTAW